MTPFITPTQDNVFAALRAVLIAALPAGVDIVQGQDNKVPEPTGPDYVIMTSLARRRIETNTDGLDDCRLTGTIAGTVLTAATVDIGKVKPNRQLFGAGVTAGTTILQQLTGPTGGAGTYLLDRSQMVTPVELMACGATDIAGPNMMDVQLDFHGGGATTDPGDYAQTVAILFRDDWAVQQFANQTAAAAAAGGVVTPLYVEDPKQIPFVSGEDQYEDRWVVIVTMQVNETISVPQEYMDSAVVGLIEVDTFYPT